jgi:hypothetical protein
MKAFKSGTWTKPTATDSELSKSFGSYGIIVVPKSSSESAPEAGSGRAANTSSAFEGSLPSILSNAEVQQLIPPGTAVSPLLGQTGSDSFLQNLFGSDWDLSTFDPSILYKATETAATTSPQQPIPLGHPTISHIPLSPMRGREQVSEQYNAGMTAAATFGSYDQTNTTTPNSHANYQQPIASFDDPRASILWEAFLREVDVPPHDA